MLEPVIQITFQLRAEDLAYFRDRLERVRANRSTRVERDVIAQAEALAARTMEGAPAFVSERLQTLTPLIAMLRDEEWSLAGKERERVLDALAYFAESDDIIPDDAPVLGYLDDAIMVELVAHELQPELDAFKDFCLYRELRPEAEREAPLVEAREELQRRLRRRDRSGRTYGGGRTAMHMPHRLF